MKKHVPAASLLAFAMLTAGCSTTTDSSGSTSSGGVIHYLHRLPGDEETTKVNDIVARWNAAHPDMKIEATKFDGKVANMNVKLENDAKVGTSPCLAQIGYTEIPELYTSGLLIDISTQAEKYREYFSEGSVSLIIVGKTVVDLPQDFGPLVYFYNKTAFSQLGLKVPTTSTELAEVAKKAAEQGKCVPALGPSEAPNILAGQAVTAGAQWFSVENDKWRVSVSSPETVKVPSFWQGILDSKLALVTNHWGDAFGRVLVDQQLISTIGAAWEDALLAGTMKGSPNTGSWAVAQLSAFGDRAISDPDGGLGVAVFKGCSNPEGAMAFDDWFNTQVDDLATQGLVLAAKAPMRTPQTTSTFSGGQGVYAEFIKANVVVNSKFGFTPTWPSLADPTTKTVEAAERGTDKVDKIFRTTQKISVGSLKGANLPVAEQAIEHNPPANTGTIIEVRVS